ncbi:CBS and ACT domain-containing protein [Desulforhopalus sp. IMCC35007]|uniref:CBS and ACT domain-containing protein n=1 Tax=Desulforhopalus sp. IMCC35007 TaxID=2569543 RepID=UPI0010ADEF9F|nr:CBS and ACT domain-containing protein [Desulforhopalus sp. IMCC35007]TKB09106.1 CBS domain-containing protein [Desulforhopalus sp. IMCC35007]
MFVSERMATNLITVGPDLTIFEAKKLMGEKSIRHLPVVDSKGKLLGIISDRDMRDAMPSTLLKKPDYEITLGKIGGFPVSDIMTSKPLTIYPYYTLQDTLLVMQKKKVGALPVVDEEGYLKGILSTRDLLRAFVNVLNIDEPGTLLCIVVKDQPGQMKKIVDIISEENISLGSVLVTRYWEEDKRAIFPYLLTNNVIGVKKKLIDLGFELLDPLKWYLDQLPKVSE